MYLSFVIWCLVRVKSKIQGYFYLDTFCQYLIKNHQLQCISE
ncbi:hypothetical protein FDUTEX481_09881 [Tolypothrix sp. PCC 7601]|nr:hypothetical protein FDUTEX481_09881 [Tolypothrix sp. PCC 7601]